MEQSKFKLNQYIMADLYQTSNDILYEEFYTGPQGARFILHPVKGFQPDEWVEKAKAELRENRDVVDLKVDWWTPGKDVKVKYYFLGYFGGSADVHSIFYISPTYTGSNEANRELTKYKMKRGKPIPSEPEVNYSMETMFTKIE